MGDSTDTPRWWFLGRHGSVHLYVPNVIGYVRILAALLAFACAMSSPITSVTLYFLSFACDELDGRFARMLGQQSTLGAVLDMVTDRVATCGLVAVLLGRIVLAFDGSWSMNVGRFDLWGWQVEREQIVVLVTVVLIGLMFLDIFSHWFHMYASLATKGFGSSHKDLNNSDAWLLRMYYQHRIFMGYCCVSVEVLYLVAYLMTFDHILQAWGTVLLVIFALTSPGFLIKQTANVVQLRNAAIKLIDLDTGNSRKSPQKGRARSKTPRRK
jgi:CDP-diacylglycerol--inositol 3-phosphatidyltransferase